MTTKLSDLGGYPIRVSLLFLTLAMPLSSHAGSWTAGYWSGVAATCTECTRLFAQLDGLIRSSTDIINTNINDTRSELIKAIKTNTDAGVGSVDKQSGGSKELAQGNLNYMAGSQAIKVLAEAQDLFTAPSSDLMDPESPANACATMAMGSGATTASSNAALTARALSAADSRKNLYTSNSSGVLAQAIQTHNAGFCSDQSAKRGICPKVATEMQDADQNAGSLLAPSAGRTYSADQSKAARAFINNVIGPVPQEMLSIVQERSPAGQRFLVEQRAMNAVQSMAVFALNSIFANNDPEDPSAKGDPGNKISLVGYMQKFINERFGDPKYRIEIAKLDEKALLIQIAENMAFQNFMEYHQYLQGERTEGLLATTLAINTRQRSETVLPALRQQVLR